MKIFYLLPVMLAASAEAFVPLQAARSPSVTQLGMGWMDNFNFRPMHGHGSGEKKLGEIYREEQAVLQERKKQGYTKDSLKKKYKKREGNKSFLEDFFSHPFHGHGSGEDESELDSMYAAQQQVLYERREYYGNKDKLRKKYSRVGEDHIKDIPLHQHDPKVLNQKEDEAMYVDDDQNDNKAQISRFRSSRNSTSSSRKCRQARPFYCILFFLK